MTLVRGKLPIRQISVGLAGTYSEVAAFTLPQEGDTGQRLEFVVEGHLFGSPPWDNFAAALFYDSGPVDSITVTMNDTAYEVPRGTGVLRYTTVLPSPSYRLTLVCSMTLNVPGEYQFSAMTGWYNTVEDVINYDEQVTKPLSVVVPAPPFPWWLVVTTAGGIGIIAVIGVVAWMEIKRQEEMMYQIMAR